MEVDAPVVHFWCGDRREDDFEVEWDVLVEIACEQMFILMS